MVKWHARRRRILKIVGSATAVSAASGIGSGDRSGNSGYQLADDNVTYDFEEDDALDNWSVIWTNRSDYCTKANDWSLDDETVISGDQSLHLRSNCDQNAIATDERVLSLDSDFTFSFKYYHEDSDQRGAFVNLLDTERNGSKDGDRVTDSELMPTFISGHRHPAKSDPTLYCLGQSVGVPQGTFGPNSVHNFTVRRVDDTFTVTHDQTEQLTFDVSDVEVDLSKSYRLMLSSSGSWGDPSNIWFDSIRIPNEQPVSRFSVSNSDPPTGTPVTFDGSESSDPDGSVQSYNWDFDDDGEFESSGRTVSHTFDEPGEYDVTLRVTDDRGATATTSQVVTVSGSPPVVAVNWSPEAPIVGDQITFDGSESSDQDGTIQSYEWDFGDGSVDTTGAVVTHSYDEAGDYTVTLTVTDTDGRTSTVQERISVEPDEPPTATFERDRGSPMADQIIEFDASGSSDLDGSIQSYDWDFTGDGSTDATGVVVEHVYEEPGNYTVTLTVTDSQDSTTTETVSLSVDPATLPVAIDDNNNGVIDDEEIDQATQYWQNGTEVPGTDGKTISDSDLLELTRMWRNETEVDS